MIPEAKKDGVARALRDAFGVAAFEDIQPMTKGQTTSLVFRIVVRGSPFLLKIILRADDPACHYTCMKAAAGAGLAPRVWYTSIEDKISITDFVDAVPFPVADALVRMPATLRSLHALPPFPGRANHLNTSCMFLIHKGAPLDAFLQRIQAANLLPQGESEELFSLYEQVAAAYPRPDPDMVYPDMVSSHNDFFKPDNILFDGHRVWLVDWEAAFLNDRYADLAVVANLLVTNDAEERIYLQEYFGQPPDQYQLARFFLMQQVAHIFYAMAFLSIGSAGKPIDWSETVPSFQDFHRRFWAGDVSLTDNHTKIVYGRVHWERLVQNTRQARFKEALRIVAGRQPEATRRIQAPS
jgi:aminoglycoside phosphotransferase (APT) family kinase protein